MKKWNFYASLLILGAVSITVPSAVQADEPVTDVVHFSELSGYVQQTANSLCWEMYRFHQQQPDFLDAYRDAKEIWTLAGSLRGSLQNGPVADVQAADLANRMAELAARIETVTRKWGDGMRPAPPPAPLDPQHRVIVTPGAGIGVDVPFFGIRLATPRIAIAEEVPPVLPMPQAVRTYHRHARGSRRSLDRELTTLKTALGYLVEDAAPLASPVAPETAEPPALDPNRAVLPAKPKSSVNADKPPVQAPPPLPVPILPPGAASPAGPSLEPAAQPVPVLPRSANLPVEPKR